MKGLVLGRHLPGTRFACKVLYRNSQTERPGSDRFRSQLPPDPPQPPQRVEQMALSHLLLEEAWPSQEALRLAPDKAARPVWLLVHTLAAGPAVDAAKFKGTASLGPTSRTEMRKGCFDLLIVRDGTTFVLYVCVGGQGGVDFSCHYCVFMHWM